MIRAIGGFAACRRRLMAEISVVFFPLRRFPPSSRFWPDAKRDRPTDAAHRSSTASPRFPMHSFSHPFLPRNHRSPRARPRASGLAWASCLLLPLLSAQGAGLVGSWYLEDANGPAVITFLANGEFVMLQDGDDSDDSGQDGMERGTYQWDAGTGAFASQVLIDTNGEWGLSHGIAGVPGVSAVVADDELTLTIPSEGAVVLSRIVPVETNSLVGTWWAPDAGEAGGLAVITLLADGSYFFAQDGDSAEDPSGQDGIERGAYSWNPDTGAFSATVSLDTNGEWGLSHPGSAPSLEMHSAGNRFVFNADDGEGDVPLYRVREARPSLVIVEKTVRNRQLSESFAEPMPLGPDHLVGGGAFGFWIGIEGEGVEGLPRPTFTMPAAATLPVERPEVFNNGELVLDQAPEMDETEWSLGFGDQESPDQAGLNALFPNGTYSVSVGERTVVLDLSGDTYPPAPRAVLGGGAWANGDYIIDPAQDLEVSLQPFDGFGTHVEDRVGIDIDDGRFTVERLASADASTTPLSLTIPAGTLSVGQEVWIELEANIAVDHDGGLGDETPALAVYSSSSWVRVRARAPQPLTLAPGTVWSGDPDTATVWHLKGLRFSTDLPNPEHRGETFAGTATIEEKLPGLVYVAHVMIDGAGAPDHIDFLAEAGGLAFRSEEVVSGSIEYRRGRLEFADADTLIFTELETAYAQGDLRSYWLDTSAVVISRQPFPVENPAAWAGSYVIAKSVGFNAESQGLVYADSSEAGIPVTVGAMGGGQYLAYMHDPEQPEDERETIFSQVSGGLYFSELITDPRTVYTDGVWRTDIVRYTDLAHAVQLPGGKIFVGGSGAELSQVLPEVPEDHPDWVATPSLSWADVYADLLAPTVSPQTGYAGWAASRGLAGADAAPAAVALGGGLPNALRYTLNLPDSASVSALPSAMRGGEPGSPVLILDFPVRKGMADWVLVPEVSTDLNGWTELDAGALQPLADLDAQTARFRVSVPMGGPRLFLRLKARPAGE